MANRRFEMHEYRNFPVCMRLGDSGCDIVKAKLRGGKAAVFRHMAAEQGWLDTGHPLSEDNEAIGGMASLPSQIRSHNNQRIGHASRDRREFVYRRNRIRQRLRPGQIPKVADRANTHGIRYMNQWTLSNPLNQIPMNMIAEAFIKKNLIGAPAFEKSRIFLYPLIIPLLPTVDWNSRKRA